MPTYDEIIDTLKGAIAFEIGGEIISDQMVIREHPMIDSLTAQQIMLDIELKLDIDFSDKELGMIKESPLTVEGLAQHIERRLLPTHSGS